VPIIRSYQLYTWKLVCFMQVMWPHNLHVMWLGLSRSSNLLWHVKALFSAFNWIPPGSALSSPYFYVRDFRPILTAFVIVNRLWAGRSRERFGFQQRAKRFLSPPNRPDRLWAPPTLHRAGKQLFVR
jgi:hypothetical protein